MATSDEAYAEIFNVIIPQTIQAFKDKTVDYRGGPAFLMLGSKGQFSDMNRKFWKLYAAIWEGQRLVGEQSDEIVRDMIGHCFLLLYCLRAEGNFSNVKPVDPELEKLLADEEAIEQRLAKQHRFEGGGQGHPQLCQRCGGFRAAKWHDEDQGADHLWPPQRRITDNPQA